MPGILDAVNRTRPGVVIEPEPERPPVPPMKTKPAEEDLREVTFEAFSKALVTCGELRKIELPARKRLLGEFFCEADLGFVYAARGVGKTWFAQALAHAIASGSHFGPWAAGGEATPTLYIDCEMPADLSRDRDRAVAEVVTGGKPSDLMYLHHDLLFERAERTMNFRDVACQEAITRLCLAQGRRVVILDNLSTGIRGVRENEGFDWEPVQSWLLDLRHHHIAVLILAHAGRNGEMRGASKREDPASWIIKLTDGKEGSDSGACFVSHFAKASRNAPNGVPDVEWRFTTQADGTLTITHKKAEAIDRFRSLIEEGVTACGDLADLLGVAPGTVSKWAAKAQRQGWLEVKGRTYSIKD